MKNANVKRPIQPFNHANPYPLNIFMEEVCDNPKLFPCYISLIEKLGDVIWEGNGGIAPRNEIEQRIQNNIDDTRLEFVLKHWKEVEDIMTDLFKSNLEAIEIKQMRYGLPQIACENNM